MVQKFSLILLSLFILISATSEAQVLSGKYLQEIKTDVSLPEKAGKNVIKLFSVQDTIIAITPNGIYRFNNGKWKGHTSNVKYYTATLDNNGNICLVTSDFIQNEDASVKISLPKEIKNDTVLCLFWENDRTLHVGTAGGLLTWTGRKWTFHPEIKTRVNSVTKDARQNLWVASTNGLWRRSGGNWVNMDETMMDKGNHRTYYTLQTQNGGNEVLLGTPYSVGCISLAGNHWVLQASNGLPYGPVKVIRSTGDCLWFGTDRGAIKKDDSWHYYNDRRWLPDNKIIDILPIDSRTVWIATPKGISQVQQVEMTLEQKADSIEKSIQLRHIRRGLINHSYLSVPGDLSTSYMVNEDNDGLWTSCYLAAECFRYAVTNDPLARENAVRTYKALERLESVTGIPGYPARSYARATDKVKQSRSPHPKHWHTSPDGKWQWLDDTSSDEIVGHIFSIALFHDLVADESQKQRVKDLVERILNYIVDNDFQLIDLDGKPTRWGIWNPDSLNHSKNWMYERGINSLQILSHLKTAAHLTGNPKFEKAYRELTEKYDYAENTVQAKVYGPFEKSYSDDILNFFPYYNLLKYAGDDPYLPVYIKSLERSWNVVRSDRMPVWNIMASALLKKDCDVKVAIEELQQFPVDLVNWTMENSHRWDFQHEQLAGRFGETQAVQLVPAPEGNVWRWNTNPHQLDSGLGGEREEVGSYFLFAYWMGRYYKLFNEDK